MKNHEYTIKVSLINKTVEKDSREESLTDASEIESIRSRLAILMDKIDVLDPQGFGTEKLSSKILENFNFNIEPQFGISGCPIFSLIYCYKTRKCPVFQG